MRAKKSKRIIFRIAGPSIAARHGPSCDLLRRSLAQRMTHLRLPCGNSPQSLRKEDRVLQPRSLETWSSYSPNGTRSRALPLNDPSSRNMISWKEVKNKDE